MRSRYLHGIILAAVVALSGLGVYAYTNMNRLGQSSSTISLSYQDLSSLTYAFIPYTSNSLKWESMPPEAYAPVQSLINVWTKVFSRSGPNIFLDISGHKDGAYAVLLVLAGSARMVISRVNATNYNISLIMENVTTVLAISGNTASPGYKELSSELRSVRFAGFLYKGKPPVPSPAFRNSYAYRSCMISVTVRVDPKTNYYYFRKEFMGSWPYTMKPNERVKYSVVPNNYIVPEDVQKYKRFIAESTPIPISTLILKSIIINGHKTPLTNHIMKFVSIPELPNKTLQVNGLLYRYFPTCITSYYDGSTGLLLKENLSNTYIKASGGRRLIGDYLTLIPTPIHKLLKDFQIDIESLKGNALELVLTQVTT